MRVKLMQTLWGEYCLPTSS